jgi:circadian clock protein KaiC
MVAQTMTPNNMGLAKMPTGIEGFDEITGGGLPRNRTSLIMGGPGSGKTTLALQTLFNGACRWGEPGIFVAFEEPSSNVIANAASFGWDLPAYIGTQGRAPLLFFQDAHLSADDVQGGKFDLISLLAGLKAKADEMGAKRIVFDSIDVLLTLLKDPIAERGEIYRFREWLLQSDLTCVITAAIEGSDSAMSRHYGFMQFMADCVTLLQQHMANRISIRELRIIKYRGSAFEEGEFPMVIGPHGIEVTSFGLARPAIEVSAERVTSGSERLDTLLGGGYFRGSRVLLTGAPGTAKSTLCGAFAQAACRRGERTLYVSFDEDASELVRNLSSVGIHLEPHIESGVLRMYSEASEARSAEGHLMSIKAQIEETHPRCLVIDPLSAMVTAGGQIPALGVARNLMRSAKAEGITILMTSLLGGGDPIIEASEIPVSAITDTWIHVSFVAQGGERNRALTIIKSRGTRHSNLVRELVLSDYGVTLADVYTAGGDVLMGTRRREKENAVELEKQRLRENIERERRELELAEMDMLARIERLQHQLEVKRATTALLVAQQQALEERWRVDQKAAGAAHDTDKEACNESD